MMLAPRHHCAAILAAAGLSVGSAALGQSDWRSQLRSSRAVERETALLQLGDAGLADAGDLEAVAGLLDDPLAAVRWNAVAALRKAGPAVTPVLLARLADGRMSTHVGSYFNGCGRTLFVPSEGELAAAALAASPEADADALWRRFAEGDGETTRLLGAVLEAARTPPPPTLMLTAHRLRDEARDLMLRLTDANDPQMVDALSAALDAARIDRQAAFERQVAEVLSGAGPAGRAAVAKGLGSSAFPEAWLSAALSPAGDAALAARAFEAAALSGRPQALRAIALTLARVSRERRREKAGVPAWLERVSPTALRAFLAQPLGDSAETETLAGAARHIVPRPDSLPAVIDLLARMLVASERDPRRLDYALGELAKDLATAMGPAERRQAWSAVGAQLAAPGARNAAFATVIRRFPPPNPEDRPTLARSLVAAVFEGRLSPTTLSPKGEFDSPQAPTPDATAWRAMLRAAVPATAPGRESARAALLAALDADAAQVLQAWRDVATSATATPAEIAKALAQLVRHEETRAWATARLMRHLTSSTDRTTASVYTAALWGDRIFESMSFDAKERQRRALVLDGIWAQVMRLAPGSTARAAGIQRLFTGTEYDMQATTWVARAAAALGTSDAAADAALLAYLAHVAPDISAQTLPCNLNWLYADRRQRPAPLDAGTRTRLASALRAQFVTGGTSGDLALRVWRGFGLPSDAGIDARVRQAEAAMAASCPVAGSAATMADLAATLKLPAGDATRAHRFAEVLNARSSTVACAATDGLAAMGGDAVPGAAVMLRYWVDGSSTGPRVAVPERATCDHNVPFATAFARGLAGLAPEHRRVVLQQALAADKPRHGAGEQREAVRANHAQPAWEPLPDEVEAWALEHGERDQERVPAALLDAMNDVLDAQLRERLEAGPPGPGWVLLAESHWLRASGPAVRRRSEARPEMQADPGARSVLPALATHWPALTAAQRARLLPLLGAADPEDAAALEMVGRSLENPAGGERAAALRVATRLWPDDPRLPPLVRSEAVARALSERLERRFNAVFDALRPPGAICCAGGGTGERLPAFPWPPPAGYRTPEPLALDWFGPPDVTAGAWFDLMRRTMSELSSDYETGLFSGPPGGFALVARLERIDASGKPYPGRARWTTEGQPKLDLVELLGDLFLERPGHFRIVVFVVTDQPNFQADPRVRLPDVRDGAQVMPPGLATMPLAGKYVLALVYSFERRQGEQMRAWVDGSPSTLQHLHAAGIWQRLSKRP
jgi:hypothetical protein